MFSARPTYSILSDDYSSSVYGFCIAFGKKFLWYCEVFCCCTYEIDRAFDAYFCRIKYSSVCINIMAFLVKQLVWCLSTLKTQNIYFCTSALCFSIRFIICYAIIVFSSCANFGLILYINGESVSGQMENILSERVQVVVGIHLVIVMTIQRKCLSFNILNGKCLKEKSFNS